MMADDRQYEVYYPSPVGVLKIAARQEGIVSLDFTESTAQDAYAMVETLPECLRQCLTQLDEYFAGARTQFQLALLWRGTEFQLRVWRQLALIPYGKTCSYRDIAAGIGNPRAVRAVGGANHKNPWAILIPCHRVIAHDGGLGGYGGGLWRKQWLLDHEARHCAGNSI